MSRKDQSHQCYVCRRKYPDELLGRLSWSAIPSRKHVNGWHVICQACYTALRDSYLVATGGVPPVLHGF